MYIPKTIAEKVNQYSALCAAADEMTSEFNKEAMFKEDICESYDASKRGSIISRMRKYREYKFRIRRIASRLSELSKETTAFNKRASRLKDELIVWFCENDPVNYDIVITGFCIAKEPEGEAQGGGEYAVQYVVDNGRRYSGTYFYPIEGSTAYIAMNYECVKDGEF